ncbi:MAG: ATP-binding protein [Chloroflexi bacterium]|nr:ATP-binding protein [Chloroflexota bacterium]
MVEPAKTLREAFNAVDPAQPLAAEDNRYVICTDVRGGEDVVSALFRAISLFDRPLHQLCTGHRGCGKSTELLRLKTRLEAAGFEVIYFEADEDHDLNDLVYSDLLLAIARRIEIGARERGLSLERELKGIERWFAEVVYSEDEWRQVERELHAEAALGLGLPESMPLVARLLARLTGQIKTGHIVKNTIRGKLDQQVSHLIAVVNELLARVEVDLRKQKKRGLVVIVDNLDRVALRELGEGRTSHDALFVEHGEQLRSLACHVIYTVPISMFYSIRATQLTGLFPRYQIVPMIRVRAREGADVSSGLERLKMTPAAAERAVRRLVAEFGRMIPEPHFPLLARVHRLKTVQNDADHQAMLFNLSVLEYTNGQPPWHDVHPVVLRLPKFKEAWERESKSARSSRRKSARKPG